MRTIIRTPKSEPELQQVATVRVIQRAPKAVENDYKVGDKLSLRFNSVYHGIEFAPMSGVVKVVFPMDGYTMVGVLVERGFTTKWLQVLTLPQEHWMPYAPGKPCGCNPNTIRRFA